MIYAYIRVSTTDQQDGHGLDAQRNAILQATQERGWPQPRIAQEIASAGRTDNRPALHAILDQLEPGDTLVVTKVDRLSRSMLDFASIVQRARDHGWELVVVEQGFDMGTAAGRAMAGMLAVFAEFEREMISERTKAGLAVARAKGIVGGRKGQPAEVISRVLALRAHGRTLDEIAAQLNEDGVPCGQGAALWQKSSVRWIVQRHGRAA